MYTDKPEPKPVKGKKIIYPLVVQDIENRAKMSKPKYGRYLESHNGRSALVDAYEEALDLAMYLRQLIEEEKDREEVEELVRLIKGEVENTESARDTMRYILRLLEIEDK